MTDYTELIKALRHCSNETRCGCSECKYDAVYRCKETMMRDAADAIEEMSKPRWIPVTERLPDEDTLVLVWRYNGLPYVSRRTDSTYWLGLGRDSGITHWMPLPAPPKEET